MLMEKKDGFIQKQQVQQETFGTVRFMSVHSRHKSHCRIYARDFCGGKPGVTAWVTSEMPSASPVLEGGSHWPGRDLGLGLAEAPGRDRGLTSSKAHQG